jgi:hypothetical protein
MYRFLRIVDPLIRSALALGMPGLDGIVSVSVAGRRTARRRQTLLTLLTVDGRWYIGHPNGDTGWTRNAAAAGEVEIEPAPGAVGTRPFRVTRLPAGDERDRVIAATRTQQPFPGNVIYSAARRHIEAVGVYFRLEPSD